MSGVRGRGSKPKPEQLPVQLTPPGCDLRDFPFMPIDIARLLASEFHAFASDSAWRAGVTLWLRSWHQVPAGSLPDDEVALTRLADLGRDQQSFRDLREEALRGWFRCADGRLYHKVVAEKALEAWLGKLSQRLSSGAGNASKYGHTFDRKPIDAQIDMARDMLAAISPNSKAIQKSRRQTSRVAPDGSPGGSPDGSPSGSQETGDRDRGQRQGTVSQEEVPIQAEGSGLRVVNGGAGA